jgi:hypothetical protein
MTIRIHSLLIAGVLISGNLSAQDSLDSLVNKQKPVERNYVMGTFKGTRIINLQSVEKASPGTLQFQIQHRFGAVNGGGYEFFGLDQATMRIALEYGLHRAIAIGIGRSTLEKNFDGYTKISLLRQAGGTRPVPISLSYFGSIVINGIKETPGVKYGPAHRLTYTHQLLLARKVSERFSIELAPTWIHKNQVIYNADPNNFFAIGAGARIKLTRRTSFNIEYIDRIPPANSHAPSYDNFYNSFSVGFDIETGGHVFQLHLTNSLAMVEKGFITETSESWGNGGIHLGFNISRDFVLKRGKTAKSW